MFGLFKKADKAVASGHFNAEAKQILIALGGAENIVQVSACITRLRVRLKDFTQIEKNMLQELGAVDVVKVGSTLQIIFGAKSAEYALELNQLLTK